MNLWIVSDHFLCQQNDIEIPVPKYFINERAKVLQEREKVLGQILAKMGPQDEKTEEVKMTTEEAIRIIQVHERARQGRLRAKFMREIRLQEERERLAANRGAPTLDADIAAIRIQKVSVINYFLLIYYLNIF